MEHMLKTLLSFEGRSESSLTPSELGSVLEKMALTESLISQARYLHMVIEKNLRAVGAVMGLTEEEIEIRLRGK